MPDPDAPETFSAEHTGHLDHVHRFLLMGETDLVAYHLALFKVPAHAYQAVLTVTMDPAAAKEAYLKDLRAQKDPAYTYYYSLLTTEHFPLVDIKKGNRTSMTVKVERVRVSRTDPSDRTFTTLTYPDGNGVRATVKFGGGVRYFEDIQVGSYPDTYAGLLFGTPSETFLAHKLVKKPHWDEAVGVSTVKVDGKDVTQDLLNGVPLVNLPTVSETPHDRTTSPLDKDSAHSGMLTPGNGGKPVPVTFTVGTQRWWNHTSLNDEPM